MTPTVRPVSPDQWGVVAWLWQAFRNDLAPVVHGFPLADGRYRHALLDDYPSADRQGLLAWSPHPHSGEPSPLGFALVDGLTGPRRSVAGFFVVPAARRHGVGRLLALETLERFPGPWDIAFQHDNESAGRFWRGVAATAFGDAWTEERRPVPDKPDVPPDHWIAGD